MEEWSLSHELIKAGISLIVPIVTLSSGSFVGSRLTLRWNIRQKRRELQLSATQQFYSAYGEFFAVWKLWNRLDRTSECLYTRRWELHKRAAAAEAIVEGTFVKLSIEIILKPGHLDTLGRFRQAFQQLRQAIRNDHSLEWSSSEQLEYRRFKNLLWK